VTIEIGSRKLLEQKANIGTWREAKSSVSLRPGCSETALPLTVAAYGSRSLTKTCKMAQDNVHRLQDTFLEHLQRKRAPVTIFLANGVRLQGIVAGYDAFCVLLDCNGHQQIVYKHAITTTVPASAVDLQDKSGPVETIQPKKPTLIVERRGRSRFARS
jgi:host factor-I protein